MNSKIVLLSRILPLITGCSTQAKDIQYLHDDNGFPYTEEELNRKNTFHNQYEYVSDYDSSGKLKSPLQFDVKKTGDKKSSGTLFPFTVGIGLLRDSMEKQYLSIVPYLYCQFSFENSEKDFGYKVLAFPAIGDTSYHRFSLSINNEAYNIYDICLDIDIDFTACYSILGDDKEATLTLVCLAPKQAQTIDFNSEFYGDDSLLCSKKISYKFQLQNNGNEISVHGNGYYHL